MTVMSKIGRLSVKLARESYFGPALMKQCTVFGCQDKPPLPKDDVENLKKMLLSLYPQFRGTPLEFEPAWKTCVDSINHACFTL